MYRPETLSEAVTLADDFNRLYFGLIINPTCEVPYEMNFKNPVASPQGAIILLPRFCEDTQSKIYKLILRGYKTYVQAVNIVKEGLC